MEQTYCTKCGSQCTGKMLIELRQGSYKPFCQACFSCLEFKDMKEVRVILKKCK